VIRDDGLSKGMDVDAIVEASIVAGEAAMADIGLDDIAARPPRSPFKVAMRRFMKHRLALVSLVFIVALGFMAVFAPVVAPAIRTR
jgi:hypothetical protein